MGDTVDTGKFTVTDNSSVENNFKIALDPAGDTEYPPPPIKDTIALDPAGDTEYPPPPVL